MSSDVIPIVLGIIIAALIFWGGRASQPRRSARFDKFQRRSLEIGRGDLGRAADPNQSVAPDAPAPKANDPGKADP